MKTPRLAVTVLAALAFALAGCAPSAPASNTPSPTSPGAVTEPQTPEPDPVPAEIVVSGAGFTIIDDADVTVFTHVWADEVAPAVAALTGAFQSEPTRSIRDGIGGHYADFDLYTWGSFTLGDAVGLEKDRADYFLPSLVEVTESEVAGIAVLTASGVGVGSTVASVSAVEPLIRSADEDAAYFAYLVDPVNPAAVPYVDGGEITDMVQLQADPTDTTITLLKAPTLSYYPF